LNALNHHQTRGNNMKNMKAISTYTQEQALDDGNLIELGKLSTGQKVVVTSALFESFKREKGMLSDESAAELDKLIQHGVEMLNIPAIQDSESMKLRAIEPNIWVVADGNGLTFMRPDDY